MNNTTARGQNVSKRFFGSAQVTKELKVDPTTQLFSLNAKYKCQGKATQLSNEGHVAILISGLFTFLTAVLICKASP